LPLSPSGAGGATTLELILTPFHKGKRSGQSFVIQLLKCVFSASLSNKKSISKIYRNSLFIIPSRG
jgi:hypothetical protein